MAVLRTRFPVRLGPSVKNDLSLASYVYFKIEIAKKIIFSYRKSIVFLYEIREFEVAVPHFETYWTY